MKKQQNITYTIIDPNTDRGTEKILKKTIIEKLALLHEKTQTTTN